MFPFPRNLGAVQRTLNFFCCALHYNNTDKINGFLTRFPWVSLSLLYCGVSQLVSRERPFIEIYNIETSTDELSSFFIEGVFGLKDRKIFVRVLREFTDYFANNENYLCL